MTIGENIILKKILYYFMLEIVSFDCIPLI